MPINSQKIALITFANSSFTESLYLKNEKSFKTGNSNNISFVCLFDYWLAFFTFPYFICCSCFPQSNANLLSCGKESGDNKDKEVNAKEPEDVLVVVLMWLCKCDGTTKLIGNWVEVCDAWWWWWRCWHGIVVVADGGCTKTYWIKARPKTNITTIFLFVFGLKRKFAIINGCVSQLYIEHGSKGQRQRWANSLIIANKYQ